ncbi:MAG: type II secretion system protein [Gammaproteobacteria bacterium]|nr:MAG: type II secretion system protein [Gammaproteobacteria bacterium]
MRAPLPQRSAQHASAGFTLVEAVVTIVLLGLLAGIAAVFIVRPMQGYVDLSRRAALVEAAESALRRMARDARLALPNSVRRQNLASGFALEMIPTLDGAKYNIRGTDNERLRFNGDTDFDLLGCFRNPATKTTPGIRLAINNRGVAPEEVYADAQRTAGQESLITPASGLTISITSTTCPASGWDHIALSSAHDFRGESPNQRLFVVTTAVSYVCDTSAGMLTRYAAYPIPQTQPVTAVDFAALSATSAVVVDRVKECSVTTTTDEVRNRGLVTLTLTLESEGERIRLIHQAALDNSR